MNPDLIPKHIKTLVVMGDSYCYGAELSGAELVPFKYGKTPSRLLKIEQFPQWPYFWRNSFPGIVAHRLGLNLINLAIPGISNQGVFKRSINFLYAGTKKFSVDPAECLMLVYWTGLERREFYDVMNKKHFSISPVWNKPDKDHRLILHNVYQEYFWDEKIDKQLALAYQFSMQETLKGMGVTYFQDYTVSEIDVNTLPHVPAIDPLTFPTFYDGSQKITNYITGPVGPLNHPLEAGHYSMALKLLDNLEKLFEAKK